MNDFIELRRIATVVLRKWWVLVLVTVIASFAGYVYSRQQTPVYQASATILVGDSITSSRVDRTDIQVSEALVTTYIELARRQPVLQGVITTLNLNESWQNLSKQVEVTLIEGTQLIEVKVQANSPDMAQMIADEIINQLILFSPTGSENRDNEFITSFNRQQIVSLQERIADGQKRVKEIETAMSTSISEIELAELQKEKTTLQELIVGWERNYTELLVLTEPKKNPTQLTIIEPAHSSNRVIRPRIQLNTILGGALGMVVAMGLIFLLDFLDDTYKSLNDVSRFEGLNILGSIRKIKGRKLAEKIVAHSNPYSPITESYRIIRSRIRFKPADKPARSIMVTSSVPEEGKSISAANLAIVFAQANFRTVLVDADFRHPSLHEMFNVDNDTGLGNMLDSSEIKLEQCLKATSVKNLQILTSGSHLPDPSERVDSERMDEILTELKEYAEILIFDSPPVLVFADAIVLSRRMDGIIMVIRAGKSRRGAVSQALVDLKNANVNLLGGIFNQSPKSDTFSVNKAYMQERPQLPFVSALIKKPSGAVAELHNLRDSALPIEKSDLSASALPIEKLEVSASEMPIENLDISTLATSNENLDASTSSDVSTSKIEEIEENNISAPAQQVAAVVETVNPKKRHRKSKHEKTKNDEMAISLTNHPTDVISDQVSSPGIGIVSLAGPAERVDV
jgi:capsular exopolysaccharide synthesis family protein